jgi:hypothetical protein
MEYPLGTGPPLNHIILLPKGLKRWIDAPWPHYF